MTHAFLQGDEQLQVPLHLQVSSVSPAAQAAVEAAGGSITRVYYTKLGLRALLKVTLGLCALMVTVTLAGARAAKDISCCIPSPSKAVRMSFTLSV